MNDTAGVKADREIEALLEVFVSAGHLHAAEERQIEKDYREGDHDDRHLHQEVNPIGGVDFGGYRHEADGRELRAVDREPRGPPGHASSGEEKVVAGEMLSGEINAHEDEAGQVNGQGDVVDGSEAEVVVNRGGGRHGGRAVAGTVFAGGDDGTAPPGDSGGGDVSDRGLAEVGPGVGDGVIAEDVAGKARVVVAELVVAQEVGPVVAAEDGDMARPQRGPRGRPLRCAGRRPAGASPFRGRSGSCRSGNGGSEPLPRRGAARRR